MSIQLIGGAEFLHIPKTGGSWVTSVLKHNNLINSLGHKHISYDLNLFHPAMESGTKHFLRFFQILRNRLLSNYKSGKITSFRFCFVRNPLTWYESYWKYMKGKDWEKWGEINSAKYWHPTSILNDLGSDDFNEFIWNVIRKRPGYVSELFFSYAKPGISFIGRTENLRDDLLEILTILALKVDRFHLLNSSKVNVSKTQSSSVEWDPKLRNMIMRLELPALIHFGYLNEKEQVDLGIGSYVHPNTALHIKK